MSPLLSDLVVKRARSSSPAWALALALLSPVIPAAVGAQPSWLADRMDRDGPGIRAGRLELHPSFAAEIGYDANVFLEDQGTNGSVVLQLVAGLTLSTLGAERMEEAEGADTQKLTFTSSLHVNYFQYLNTPNGGNVGGDLSAQLVVLPQGRFGFSISESFTRTVRPFVDATGSGSPSYGQNTSVTQANLRFQSPGGNLRSTVGYRLRAAFFDSTLFQANNNLTHGLTSELTWAFFPRTALFWNMDASFMDYRDNADSPAYQLLRGSRSVSTSIGVNGVLSTRVSATLGVGYTASIYEGDVVDDVDGITARAELRLRPRDMINLSFGYSHGIAQSYIGGYVMQDNLYAQAQMMFGGRFLLGLQLTGGYNRSGVALQSDGMTPLGNSLRRKDFRTLAQLYAEYRATSWLAVLTHIEYQADMTDYRFADPVSDMSVVIPDPGAGYQRVEAWLGVRIFR